MIAVANRPHNAATGPMKRPDSLAAQRQRLYDQIIREEDVPALLGGLSVDDYIAQRDALNRSATEADAA